MLYRTPRFSLTALLRAAAARVVSAAAEFHRTGSDTAYLDGLSDDHLRDLGVRRVSDRHLNETFYR
jgi:hypothetical protein